jgi:hypothetical protein
MKWALFAVAVLATDQAPVALLAATLSLLGVLIAIWMPGTRQGIRLGVGVFTSTAACAGVWRVPLPPSRQLQRAPPLRLSPHFCRLHYPLELLISIAQPLCACSLFHHLYPTTAGASALRALACVVTGNGVLALACLAKTSPLTFRWGLL